MINRHLKPEARAYFESPDINQSTLKTLQNGPYAFQTQIDEEKLYYEEKGSLIIGTGVDILLTSDTYEEGEQNFADSFFFSFVPKPSDAIKSIVQKVYDENVTEENKNQIAFIDLEPQIIESINYHRYREVAEGKKGGWGMDAKVREIYKSGTEYFDAIKNAHGKQIIDPQEKDTIFAIRESLITNERTRRYFASGSINGNNVQRQVVIYFTYRGHRCKAMIDSLVIDHNAKEIWPMDLKTTGDYTLRFHYSFQKFRYDIQAAWYTLALSLAYPGYTIQPFRFVVESTKKVGEPLVYINTADSLTCAFLDRPSSYNGKIIRGINSLLDDYQWYLDHGFDEHRFVTERNGNIHISYDSIS